ncbi:MAG: T9SS type B sorting domain-containing protein [Bacteroidota bacterium]
MHLILRKYGMLMLLLVYFQSYSQQNSKLGRFSVEYQRGCSGVTVSITTSASFSGYTNSYFYEEGMLDLNDTFYTYTDPGIYQIVQLTQETISPKTDTLIFEVLPATSPQFEIYECGSQTVQVDISESVYDFYRVHYTATDSVDYLPGDPFPTFTYPTNNVQVLVEGIYSNSYPGCGSTFKSIVINNTLNPVSITNASLTQTCGTLFDLNLTSTAITNIKYQVEISLNGGSYTPIYEGPISNTLTVRDVNNPGFLDYCLRINTVEACSNTITNGPDFCGSIPPSQFDYLSNAYASYSGNKIAIVFSNQSFQDVLIQNTSISSPIDTVSSSTLYPSLGSNTYQLIMIDSCETILDTATVQPPYLTITDRNYEINEISLELDDPINTLTEISRELVIYSLDSTVADVVDYDPQIRLSANIGSIQKIRARYWFSEITEPIYSNEVTTRFVYRIYVPTAFTPNNDGLNDRLEFFGLEGNAAEVSIFNRWGQRIHYTDNLSLGWNGFVNEELAPEGSYTYEIKFTSPDGKEVLQVGTFALIIK